MQQFLQQQLLQQQQMFTFFSGCFGPIYRHIGLPEPQTPTQQLQFDPAGPPQPIGGFVQTPRRRSRCHHFFRQGCSLLRCAQYLEQEPFFQQLPQGTVQPSRLPASVVLSLPITTLNFDETPPPPLPIRPEVVRPSSTDSAAVTSLAASLAPVTESRVSLRSQQFPQLPLL
ncbi:hypothetical protein GQ55_9G352700 [Panicum hallii var. hallii]|jgi:hypothetical protein|uniref:Uncharacterized protein n=1 Tax=Panicum hallii var. hallii TaxID=1504633 RepID=A0A2T7C8L5_9POAL|nr:hypothetical protein GQ55_9G352700 [Panicum hallii var. hallii]